GPSARGGHRRLSARQHRLHRPGTQEDAAEGRPRGRELCHFQPREARAPFPGHHSGGAQIMSKNWFNQSEVEVALRSLLSQRILMIDGAMGTQLQGYKLTEEDFRGDRFREHPRQLKGNNDLLVLTRPDVVRAVHEAYFEAGADIVETNTFAATSIAQADYGLEAIVYELNVAAARLAREAADAMTVRSGQRRFVAGSIGPTNRT